jgi:molecular chaperone Hsp33
VLERFPEAERIDMRNAEGLVDVDCAFCSRVFSLAV